MNYGRVTPGLPATPRLGPTTHGPRKDPGFAPSAAQTPGTAFETISDGHAARAIDDAGNW